MMRIRIIGLLLLFASFVSGGCKSNGMALTHHGQLFKINIYHPPSIAAKTDGDIDVVISNRGVNNVRDLLLDVELPLTLAVDAQRVSSGVNELRDPHANVYHYTLDRLTPAIDKHIVYRVHAVGGEPDGRVTVVAWQRDLPGVKLQAQALVRYSR